MSGSNIKYNNKTLADENSKETSSEQNKTTLDNVLKRCGDLGRYQLIHFVLLNAIAAGGGINAFYYVYGAAEPLFRCRLPSNVWPDEDQFQAVNGTHQTLIDTWQSSTSNCHWTNETKCTDFVYDGSIFGRTFTEEAQLVCGNAVKRTWLSTVYYIGV